MSRNSEKRRASQRKAQNKYYQKNKAYYRQKTKEHKARVKQWVFEYKQTHPCIECGADHPAYLVFHHRDPTAKDLEVANMISRGWGLRRIEKEIEKCDVLCANCHMLLHWEENDAG